MGAECPYAFINGERKMAKITENRPSWTIKLKHQKITEYESLYSNGHRR